MDELSLLPSQKDEAFEIIVAYGFEPGDFKWTVELCSVDRNDHVDKIIHVPTRYYFTFDYGYDDFDNLIRVSRLSPGKEHRHANASPKSWPNQLNNLSSWLTYLRREVDTPNYWEGIINGKTLSSSSVALETENDPFSETQKERITIAIERVKSDLTQLREKDDIVDEQLDYAIGQLDYLVEALPRLGKRDWIHTAIGVLATFAASKIDVSTINQFWLYLQEAISGAIRFLPSVGG